MLRSSYATSGKLGFPIHICVIDGDDEPQCSTSPLHGQEYEGYDECGQYDDGADAHERNPSEFHGAQCGLPPNHSENLPVNVIRPFAIYNIAGHNFRLWRNSEVCASSQISQIIWLERNA
jgi:hypothetical protein